MSELLLDRAGRRRSPATLPGFHAGHAPANKGPRYPADPPKVESIIAVMRAAGEATHGRGWRGADRDHVASGAAHPGSAGSRRGRSRSTPWLGAGPARRGRAPSRGRHRCMGTGRASALGGYAARAPVGFCSVSSTARRADATGRPLRAELRRTAGAADAAPLRPTRRCSRGPLGCASASCGHRPRLPTASARRPRNGVADARRPPGGRRQRASKHDRRHACGADPRRRPADGGVLPRQRPPSTSRSITAASSERRTSTRSGGSRPLRSRWSTAQFAPLQNEKATELGEGPALSEAPPAVIPTRSSGTPTEPLGAEALTRAEAPTSCMPRARVVIAAQPPQAPTLDI